MPSMVKALGACQCGNASVRENCAYRGLWKGDFFVVLEGGYRSSSETGQQEVTQQQSEHKQF